MNNLNINATRKLTKNLKLCLDCLSADLYINSANQQTNVYDCVIHLLEFICCGNVAEISALDPSTVDGKINEILDVIKGLGGIF